MFVDFHIHSNKSDGSFSPVEIVQMAKQRNLKIISLTDHDSVAGIEVAQQESKKQGIQFIPGIEISALYPKGTLHILGFFIDIHSPILTEKLKLYQKARNNRNKGIIEKLQSFGIDITLKELEGNMEPGVTIGRPHIAKLLVQKKVVGNVTEAFQTYLANPTKINIEKEIFNIHEVIDLIHTANGKAFIAHPITLHKTKEELYSYFKYLKDIGLDGIEVYTSAHNHSETTFFKKLAEKLELLISGGSDFHGTTKHKVKLGFCHGGLKIKHEWVSDCFHLI